MTVGFGSGPKVRFAGAGWDIRAMCPTGTVRGSGERDRLAWSAERLADCRQKLDRECAGDECAETGEHQNHECHG